VRCSSDPAQHSQTRHKAARVLGRPFHISRSRYRAKAFPTGATMMCMITACRRRLVLSRNLRQRSRSMGCPPVESGPF
jgi:hypothetical protein